MKTINYLLTGRTHFWHFFITDFLYVIYLILEYKPTNILILNIDPIEINPLLYFFNNIKDDLLPCKLTLEKYDEKKHSQLDITPTIKLDTKGSDWKNKKNNKILNKSIKWLKKKTIKHYNGIVEKDYDTIIQLRGNNLAEKYKCSSVICTKNPHKKKTNATNYGSDRRKIDDLDKLPQYLKDNFNINAISISNDGAHIYTQIYPYLFCKRMILCHGAGMVFRLFLEKKSKVLEIIPIHQPNKIYDENSDKIRDFMSEKLNKIIIKENKIGFSKNSVFNLEIDNLIKEYIL